jgi:hypothetical protein
MLPFKSKGCWFIITYKAEQIGGIIMNEKTLPQKGRQEIRINFPPNLQGGVYCNLLRISHTREEFIMDFMMVHEGMGAVTSRVIMSPGHMKRTVAALQENLKKYEDKIGTIREAPKPKGKLGFHIS